MQLSTFPPPADLEPWSTGLVSVGIGMDAGVYGNNRFPAWVGSHLAIILQGCVEAWDDRTQRWTLLPGAFFNGPQTRPLASRHRGPLVSMSVFIRPSAAAALVDDGAARLADAAIDAFDIWGARWRRTEERIRDAGSDAERAELLFDFVRRIACGTGRQRRMQMAARLHDAVLTSVAGAAGEMGLSARQLQRRFVDGLGTTPKRFQRIVRVEHVLRDALAGGRTGTELALRHGFYDQAHMARELRDLVGAPIGKLLQDVGREDSPFWPLRLARPVSPTSTLGFNAHWA